MVEGDHHIQHHRAQKRPGDLVPGHDGQRRGEQDQIVDGLGPARLEAEFILQDHRDDRHPAKRARVPEEPEQPDPGRDAEEHGRRRRVDRRDLQQRLQRLGHQRHEGHGHQALDAEHRAARVIGKAVERDVDDEEDRAEAPVRDIAQDQRKPRGAPRHQPRRTQQVQPERGLRRGDHEALQVLEEGVVLFGMKVRIHDLIIALRRSDVHSSLRMAGMQDAHVSARYNGRGGG
ncbi:hypothetical protein SDC9_39041 [bioreactor metagenome]|uniref:Uncharacterized protein n=1 Tax=bioreactor metagenome TaxID=1076179 RepID=A0A644VNS7_9ZZZZ